MKYVIRQRYEGCIFRTIEANTLEEALQKYADTKLKTTVEELTLCHWDNPEEVSDEPIEHNDILRVVIEVDGGVADVTEKPSGIEVVIIDRDNQKEEGESYEPYIYEQETIIKGG